MPNVLGRWMRFTSRRKWDRIDWPIKGCPGPDSILPVLFLHWCPQFTKDGAVNIGIVDKLCVYLECGLAVLVLPAYLVLEPKIRRNRWRRTLYGATVFDLALGLKKSILHIWSCYKDDMMDGEVFNQFCWLTWEAASDPSQHRCNHTGIHVPISSTPLHTTLTAHQFPVCKPDCTCLLS